MRIINIPFIATLYLKGLLIRKIPVAGVTGKVHTQSVYENSMTSQLGLRSTPTSSSLAISRYIHSQSSAGCLLDNVTYNDDIFSQSVQVIGFTSCQNMNSFNRKHKFVAKSILYFFGSKHFIFTFLFSNTCFCNSHQIGWSYHCLDRVKTLTM